VTKRKSKEVERPGQVICKECMGEVGVSSWTGILNQHARPGTREKCPASEIQIWEPKRTPPSAKTLRRRAKRAAEAGERGEVDEGGEIRERSPFGSWKSVWPVNGGLPGHGKRR
jgi:hypothetical protein